MAIEHVLRRSARACLLVLALLLVLASVPGFFLWRSVLEVVITLPPGTYAFCLYAQAATLGDWHVSATAQDGTTSGLLPTHTAAGETGARYLGLHSRAAPLTSVTVRTDAPQLAVGQFATASLRSQPAPMVVMGQSGSATGPGEPTQEPGLQWAVDRWGPQMALTGPMQPPASGASIAAVPETSPGKDPTRWQYVLVRIAFPRTDATLESPATPRVVIEPGNECMLYYQLLDTRALGG